jgi:hypothetical protein
MKQLSLNGNNTIFKLNSVDFGNSTGFEMSSTIVVIPVS